MMTSTRSGLTHRQQQEGMHRVIWASCSVVALPMFLSYSAVFALFVKQLGGTDFQAMLPGSMVLLARLVQIPVSLKVAPRRGKRFMLRCWQGEHVLWGIAFFLPILLGEGLGAVMAFLGVLFFAAMLNAAGSTFWFPMLHDLIPAHFRGRFLGRLRATWNTGGLLLILGAGLFLGKEPAIWRFEVVLFVLLALYSLRIRFVSRITTGNSLSGEVDYENWRHYVLSLFKQTPLLWFLAYYGMLGFCMGFLQQPLVLYMMSRGFPAGENVIMYSFNTAGMILSYLFAGLLVDRLGTKRVFFSAHLILCAVSLAVVAVGLLPNRWVFLLLPAAMVVSGGTIAASSVACTAQLFHLVPDRGRAFYFSLSLIVISLGIAISPLLVGTILDRAPKTWCVSWGGVSLDVFQVILLAGGMLMLLVIGMLGPVRNVRPTAQEQDTPSAGRL